MSTNFGRLIKTWRDIRRYSQLALSTETGISSRHISFLETGRAQPSRGSVLTLARVLDMPKPIVNDALLAAGFAPEYPKHEPTDVDMEPMMDAMAAILANHAPFPAIIIDGGWQIVGGNGPAIHMMQFLPFEGSMCVVDALLNDDPVNPVFQNWDEIAAWMVTRLQLETSRTGPEAELVNTYKRLANDPRCAGADPVSFSGKRPYLTMKAHMDGQELSMFTMLAEFTSAQDIAMSEQRVELFFPANETTKIYFENLAKMLA